MKYLDENDSVIEWSSEEIAIPYVSPIDNRYHRYFPDLYAKVKTKDGTLKVMLLEIKPQKQTKEPTKKSKVTKAYLSEVVEWGRNQAKWKAAIEYCSDRGWEFKILTETELGIK